jgi:glyoxylase-like metal-dependent hydrolase (beta-lactamase superfamily II)
MEHVRSLVVNPNLDEASRVQRLTRRGILRLAGFTAVAGVVLAARGASIVPVVFANASRTSAQAQVAPATATSAPVRTADSGASAVAAAAAAIQQGGAALVGIDYPSIEISSQQLASNVYALTGSADVDPGHPEAAGGRIGVLLGPDGVLLVDGQYAPLTDRVVAVVRQLSSAPIRFLVNTHEHPDHAGGNANFARLGALILAREEARQDLAQPLPPAVGNAVGAELLQALQTAAGSPADPLRLPVLTYSAGGDQIRLNGETIDLIPVPSSHTHGDTIVRFESADVMLIGDFYRNYGYPFVDTLHGGSTSGILQALDLVTSLAGPDTKLVPGHGSIVTAADVLPYRDMIVAVQASIQHMVDQGKTLQEVLDARPTAAYDASLPGGTTPLPGVGSSADRFVSTIYGELKAAPSR